MCVYRDTSSEVCLCLKYQLWSVSSSVYWSTKSEICLNLPTEIIPTLKSVCLLRYQLWSPSLFTEIPTLTSVLTVIPTLILKSVSVCLLKYQLWSGSLSVYWNTNSEICIHCIDVLNRGRAHNQDSKQNQQTILTLKSTFVCWNINSDTCPCLYILRYQLWNLFLCVCWNTNSEVCLCLFTKIPTQKSVLLRYQLWSLSS